jgi:trigger factor
MEAAIEEVNSVQRRIKIRLSRDQVDHAFKGMYEDLKKKVRLKGFRPGKAPIQLIRKFYTESARPEVFEKLVKQNLFDAIEQNNIRPGSKSSRRNRRDAGGRPGVRFFGFG